MGTDGRQSQCQNSSKACSGRQREPNPGPGQIVAVRGRVARPQRGSPRPGLPQDNARMELQSGRRMSLTKCNRVAVVEPDQRRPATAKTPAKTRNLQNSISKSNPQRPECIPGGHTLKPGKSTCVDTVRVHCWAWQHAELTSEASIGNGCKPWAA